MAILISNNPYLLGRAIGSGTRPRLTRGLLGIAAMAPTRSGDDGKAHRSLGMRQWTAAEFEMRAAQHVPAGVDGEALVLEPPVRFQIRPGALRVRIAPGHPGVSPSADQPESPWGLAQALMHLALHGTPPEEDSG